MPISKYYEMYSSVLSTLKDFAEHPLADIKATVIQDFRLTEQDLSQMLPSKKQPLWSNRLGWATTYLKHAHFISSPGRGRFQITKEGIHALNSGETIDNTFLLANSPSFRAFKYGTEKEVFEKNIRGSNQTPSKLISTSESSPSPEETPQEILERVHHEINQQLSDDLLSAVYEQSPDFFEVMVVQLLKAMGYGESATGIVTQSSRDEGIDGIIYEDKLGFNLIYVQAKKWDPESTIGRPEIQKFIGALAGQGANKGLFITTAKFSQEAIQYTKKQHTAKIVLVDGKKLTDLMIEYDFGTSTEFVYKIKRIDSDFFNAD